MRTRLKRKNTSLFNRWQLTFENTLSLYDVCIIVIKSDVNRAILEFNVCPQFVILGGVGQAFQPVIYLRTAAWKGCPTLKHGVGQAFQPVICKQTAAWKGCPTLKHGVGQAFQPVICK